MFIETSDGFFNVDNINIVDKVQGDLFAFHFQGGPFGIRFKPETRDAIMAAIKSRASPFGIRAASGQAAS